MDVITEKHKLLIKLMMLAMRVQEETDYCIFIRYSGHIDELDLAIAKSKKDYNNTVAQSYISSRRSIDDLKKAIDLLLDLLDSGDIEYTDCEYEEYVVREYYF